MPSKKKQQREMLPPVEIVVSTKDQPDYEYARDKETQIHISPDKINNCSPHFHKQVEIIALQTSQQYIQINTRQELLSAGELAISDCFDIHSYVYCDAISTVLIIPEAYLADYQLYKGNNRLKTNFVRDRAVFDKCFPLLKQIASASNPLLRKGMVDELLGRIVEAVGVEQTEKESTKELLLIHRILDYLDEHYAEDLSLNTLSDEFGYSPTHFSRLFRKFFDYNLNDYIGTLRLRKFFELKAQFPDKDLITLIFDSGFSSVPTFYRLFTKKMGSSPKKYFTNAEKQITLFSSPPPRLICVIELNAFELRQESGHACARSLSLFL